MKNKHKPDIRFAGFTEDWEQRTIDSIVERVKSYSLSRDVETNEYTGYKYIHYGDIHTKVADIIDEFSNLPNIKVGNYELLKKGDVVLADASEDYQGIATPAVITLDTPYKLVSGLHTIALRPKQVDSLFLYYLINSPTFRKYGYRIGTGMKVFGISVTNVLKFEGMFPLIEEQTKIGNLLNQLDDTIALHQQELTTLKQLKQGFSQKMFPKEGESVPEIRFPGFTGDWEQCKLGDLSEIRRGASPRPIQDPKWFDNESDVGWLRISDVTEQNGLIHHVEQHISEEGQKKTLVLNEPHLILSIAATVGKPVINYIKTGIHDGFIVFINPKFNIDFMFQWLEMFRPKWQKFGQPGSQVNINSELVREQDVFLPSFEEQEKISEFFKQLDNTIAHYQCELDILKETKKAFLQKMFA